LKIVLNEYPLLSIIQKRYINCMFTPTQTKYHLLKMNMKLCETSCNDILYHITSHTGKQALKKTLLHCVDVYFNCSTLLHCTRLTS